MKLVNFIILAVISSIIAGIIFYTILQKSSIYEIRTIPMDVKVGNYVGIVVDHDSLHLGTTPKGGKAHRNISITNNYPHDVRVIIFIKGDIENWARAEPNNIVIAQGNTQQIKFSAEPSDEVPYGEYNSTAYIYFVKP